MALKALRKTRDQGKTGEKELALCQSFVSIDAHDFGTLLAAANYFIEQSDIASAEHFAIKVLSHEANASGVRQVEVYPAEQIDLARPIRIKSAVVRKLEDAIFNACEAFPVTVPQGRLWFDGFVVAVWDPEDRLVTDIFLG